MNNLIVYLNSERVGSLEQDESGLLQFSYDQKWLEKPSAMPLSRSLPLQSEVFSGKKARPFFAGILPEEGPREKIAEILGISNTNDFAMLERIGGECAGAVSLLPEGVAPTDPKNVRHRELTEPELRQLIAELPSRPLMVGMDGLRLSLAGAQDKLPVIVHNNGICLPIGNTPSTHILKPEPDRFPGLATNEIFCMTLARAVGLNVPNTEYRPIGKKSCILVQRYDRATDEDGSTTRLHQEDFCQALGFPPERKYQAEGGPMLSDCISLLRDWSTTPVLDIPNFINILIFNVLIGNADAHGKNYSLLYSGGERRLSPYYDLVSTLAWPDLSRNLAMKIGGCESVNAFTIGDWKKMAKKTSLGWPMIRERMAESCHSVLNELDEVRAQTRKYSEFMVTLLHETIGGRVARMLEALSRQDH
ncbi:serine/threonine-protein kinase HipA [bacterium BMS3Abin10]|nr:serine/threonine-protein kinase HipA [bacterium BMS3Abin10]GBE38023.1 serine/threonine-protein kinase HipA [bacterium BMS3Bbin08]